MLEPGSKEAIMIGTIILWEICKFISRKINKFVNSRKVREQKNEK